MDTIRIGPGGQGTSQNGYDRALLPSSGSPRALGRRSIASQREAIAKALHDNVLQDFAACLLKVQLCRRLQRRNEYDAMARELRLLEEALNQTIDKVRDLTEALK